MIHSSAASKSLMAPDRQLEGTFALRGATLTEAIGFLRSTRGGYYIRAGELSHEAAI